MDKGLTSFALKISAIVAMTCCHVAMTFYAVLPIEILFCLYSLGGITYPVMSFLLVEGYEHTRSLKRYARNLLVFAAISQAPFMLCLGDRLNILFTLFLGMLVLCLWDWARSDKGNKPVFALGTIALMAIGIFCDWASIGVIMPWLFYALREYGTKGRIIVLLIAGLSIMFTPVTTIASAFVGTNELAGVVLLECLCVSGYVLIGIPIAGYLISRYNGQRGRSMKWLFYAYYPAHLLVIWAVAALSGIT